MRGAGGWGVGAHRWGDSAAKGCGSRASDSRGEKNHKNIRARVENAVCFVP
jgi:hypothetical protein